MRIARISVLMLVCLASIFAQDGTKPIAGGVVNGKAISLPVPEYPASARAVKAAGAVNVQVVIDEKGDVIKASAVSGHPLLRSTSVAAALTAKFSPSLLSGVPVMVSGTIVYNFTLPVEEDKTIEYLSLSASLRLMTIVNSNPDFHELADVFFDEFGSELDTSDLPEPFASFGEIASANPQKRTMILDDLTRILKQDRTVSETWQISVGEVFGGLLSEIFRQSPYNQSDQAPVRSYLNNLRTLMKRAPPDFPKNLSNKIKALTDLAERTDFDDPTAFALLMEKIGEIGDIILG